MTGASAAEAPIVSLRDVRVVLGGRTVLNGVNAEIRRGEFIAVLGPNGSGKSTLLRLLLGLQSLASGVVLVDGRPVRRGSAVVGYAPQGRQLDRDLPVSGRDLVGLGLDGHRWGLPLGGRRVARHWIARAIGEVGAAAYADAPAGRLSGGEQQRLLLAQALLGQPKLLLLDEPLANLDLRNQQEIVALTAQLARRSGTTVFLVAHDVNPLLPVIDRVLYLAGGAAALGSVHDVITPATLSRLYGYPVDVFRSRGRVFVAAFGEE